MVVERHAQTIRQSENWPELPFEAWKDTVATLHMWTQIVGKIRLELSPPVNHWWQVPLYVNSRGLTTSPIPYQDRIFEIQFDFIDHNLLISTSRGEVKAMPLIPRSVANFYSELMLIMEALDIQVKINTLPSEVKNPIHCDVDHEHDSYDPEYANRFWRVLVQTDMSLKEFRSFFTGKSSPSHFFWGSFDMAMTFFSGRSAPERPDADVITREAYSHEVISFGFWPGNADFTRAAFYAYAAPVPVGLENESVQPPAAFYSKEIGEFLLMYDDVRDKEKPGEQLQIFFKSAYEAAAKLANWDRINLERQDL